MSMRNGNLRAEGLPHQIPVTNGHLVRNCQGVLQLSIDDSQ